MITNPLVLIGRTFFYGGFQIRRGAWRGTLVSNPPGRLAGAILACVGHPAENEHF